MTLFFDCRFHRPPQDRDRPGFALDLAFTTGDGITALCGPSGSGKTTVVQLIAGLLTPDQGAISLGDRILTSRSAGIHLPPEARDLGVVFQDNLLFPHRTVAQNLTFGLNRRPPATPANGRREIPFDRLVAVLELGDLLTRRPTTLSGGQARRVALGRALLRSPALLLMDEPFTGLDDDLKERVVVYLERIRDEWQLPMLLVSHERAMVARLAGQVIEIQVETGITKRSQSE